MALGQGPAPKEPTLSQREFDLWREGDKQFKDTVIAHLESQTALNLGTEGRIKALETNQVRAGSIAAWISGVIAAVVAALVGAFIKGK